MTDFGTLKDRRRREGLCYRALYGIPSGQIERDAKLYAHVAEMHGMLKAVEGRLSELVGEGDALWDLYIDVGNFLDKLGDDQ